ncbi:MAG TPA: redoxin domain-containing protein, partial [Candidatus Eisenbacteria bacterium]|nr:redoxin domain-containing protein [Candidatus Eisenbacteria bacterium]
MISRPNRGAAAALAAALILSTLLADGTSNARPSTQSKSKKPAAERLLVAPEIKLARWINTKPLTAADLKGTPRLVEFWTFDCVNCRNTTPAMRELHARFGKRGLRVLGIHTPEFAHERDSAAVAAAVKREGIRYPVGLDNDHAVFDGFKNR